MISMMVGSVIFNVPLEKCGYVTITSKLLEHVGLCRTLVLMKSQLLWKGASVFKVPSVDPPYVQQTRGTEDQF